MIGEMGKGLYYEVRRGVRMELLRRWWKVLLGCTLLLSTRPTNLPKPHNP